MARVSTTVQDGRVGVVLTAGQNVDAVVLRSDLRGGPNDATTNAIRPTAVTATISSQPATLQSLTVAPESPQTQTIVDARWQVGGGIIYWTEDIFSPTGLTPGATIRVTIAGEPLTTANFVECIVVAKVTPTGYWFQTTHIGGTGFTPNGGAARSYNIQSITNTPNHPDPDYILLHNGPRGGFTQRMTNMPAGHYQVNGVIEAVVVS